MHLVHPFCHPRHTPPCFIFTMYSGDLEFFGEKMSIRHAPVYVTVSRDHINYYGVHRVHGAPFNKILILLFKKIYNFYGKFRALLASCLVAKKFIDLEYNNWGIVSSKVCDIHLEVFFRGYGIYFYVYFYFYSTIHLPIAYYDCTMHVNKSHKYGIIFIFV